MARRRTGRRKEVAPEIPQSNANAFNLASPVRPRPAFGFMGEGERQTIMDRALDLLEQHGIAVIHEKAHAAMKAAGARPGKEADRLRLPRELVAEALASTPKTVKLAGKKRENDIHLPRADKGFIMRTGTGAHGYVNPDDASYRNLDVSDVAAIAAIGSGLDEVGFIAHPFCYGVHELVSDIHGVAELIARTDKHIWLQPYNIENVEYLIRICTLAAGGEAALKENPLASCIMCSFTPLEFKVMDVEALIQAGSAGLPVHACSLPSAGGTAPISVAGNVLMAVAEVVAMVTLAHVLVPGTKVIATPLMFTLDMRTGRALHSCVESLQAKAMAIDVLKNGFGLVAHTYGAGSDTPDVDGQSMAERALLGQTVAMAGADILGGVGQLECATVFSPVQAVLDNELGSMYRGLVQSPPVDDEAFNWDEISQIGIGAHFLDSQHTLKYCRHQHTPETFQRTGRDDYEASERAGAFEAARDKALALIEAGRDYYSVDDACRREIADVVAAAEEDILGKITTHGARSVI